MTLVLQKETDVNYSAAASFVCLDIQTDKHVSFISINMSYVQSLEIASFFLPLPAQLIFYQGE